MNHGPVINLEACTRCNKCLDMCPMDVYGAGANRKEAPRVLYPDECWYCGSCVLVCPVEPSAVRLVHPLNMRLALRKIK